MSEDEQVPPETSATTARDDYGVSRVLALSDGVFAVAMTLLVIDIKVLPAPAHPTTADGLRALQKELPSLLIYGFSFLMVAISWLNHHRGLRSLQVASSRVLFRNLGLLGLICLMPFATAFFQRFSNTTAGNQVYFGVLFLLSLMSALTVPWRGRARTAAEGRGGRRHVVAIYLDQLANLPVFALGLLLASWIPGSVALVVLCLVVLIGIVRWVLMRGLREPDPDPDPYGVGRMLALSDDVFAIALTLLVLTIAIPAIGAPDTQAQAVAVLRNRGGQLVAFAISFLVVGIYWITHHRSLRRVTSVRHNVLRRNLIFLFVVCLVPFVMDFFDAWEDTVFGNQFFFAAFGIAGGLSYLVGTGGSRVRTVLTRGWRVTLRGGTVAVATGALPVCAIGILLAPVLGPGNVQVVWLLMFPLGLLERRLSSGMPDARPR